MAEGPDLADSVRHDYSFEKEWDKIYPISGSSEIPDCPSQDLVEELFVRSSCPKVSYSNWCPQKPENARTVILPFFLLERARPFKHLKGALNKKCETKNSI